MPAVAITNVVPTLTTVRIATFWASSVKLLAVPNFPGASSEKTTISSRRKARVIRIGVVAS